MARGYRGAPTYAAAMISFVAVWVGATEAPSIPVVAKTPPSPLSRQETRRLLARDWLAAVERGDAAGAIALADRFVGKPAIDPTSEKYLFYKETFEKAKIRGELFLSDGFNAWDFQLWADALFFKTTAEKIARDAAGSGTPVVPALFQAVTAKIQKKSEGAKIEPAFPRNVWDRGFGFCDRQAWVICELAYQLGYRTQVAYLIDNVETYASTHTLCEIRGNRELWLADPYFGILIKEVSPADKKGLAFYLEKLEKSKRLPNATKTRDVVFLTPAYPGDYCPRNQALYQDLAGFLGDKCPRFGEDPMERMTRYSAVFAGSGPKNLALREMRVWPFPIRVLRDRMLAEERRRNARGHLPPSVSTDSPRE